MVVVASAGGRAAVGVVGCGGRWLASIPAWLELKPKREREKKKPAAGPTEIAKSRAGGKEIGCSAGLCCPAWGIVSTEVWA